MNFETNQISVLHGARPEPLVEFWLQAKPKWDWHFLKTFLARGFRCAGRSFCHWHSLMLNRLAKIILNLTMEIKRKMLS